MAKAEDRRETDSGIEVKPVYTHEDVGDVELGRPGEPPFTRGPYPDMGPEGAVNIVFRKELEEADDPDARRAELIEDYKEQFANPYVAAERGYVDDVIEPRRTRPVLIDALKTAITKRERRPPRKHGNIPL